MVRIKRLREDFEMISTVNKEKKGKSRAEFNMEAINSVVGDAERALVAFGFQLEAAIKRSMKGGSGRVYVRKGKTHIASAPGEPPAVDYGRLRASISTNWTDSNRGRGITQEGRASESDGVGRPISMDDNFHVVVGTNVEYGPFLEFGTKRMAARPFIRPAFDQMKGRIREFIASARIGRTVKE